MVVFRFTFWRVIVKQYHWLNRAGNLADGHANRRLGVYRQEGLKEPFAGNRK
jgi:hypothetical protein